MAQPALIAHGGAGTVPESERAERQAAVERAVAAGWARIGEGALAAAVAAVRHLEDEPLLNAGLGACTNSEGDVELDAGVMEGAQLRAGGVAGLSDVRHPIDAAVAVMEDGRHVLLAGPGASRFAREHGVEMTDPSIFLNAARRRTLETVDTVGAVARDAEGHLVVAVSTGGIQGKLPGRVGDSPILGAGLYVDGEVGAAGSTGRGEANLYNLCSFLIVEEMRRGAHPKDAALTALRRVAKSTVEKRLLNARGEPNFGLNFYVLNARGEYAGVSMHPAKFSVCTEQGPQTLNTEPLFQGSPD